MGVIYVIINLVNGKVYVGKTTIDPRVRWTQHKTNARHNRSDSYLYNSMRKYGIENFVIEVIDHGESEQELNAKEIKWIATLKSSQAAYGYNCTPGGDGAKHGPSSRCRQKGWRVLSEETKAKISAAHKGRPVPRERVEKQRASLTGRKQPLDEIARRSETNRNVWANNPEKRAEQGRRSSARKGTFRWKRKLSEEERRERGERSRAWWSSPEAQAARTALAERAKAMPRAESSKKAWETRRANGDIEDQYRRIGLAQKTFRQTPEAKARYATIWTPEKRKAFGDQIRGRKLSQETLAKLSIAACAREAKKRLALAEVACG